MAGLGQAGGGQAVLLANGECACKVMNHVELRDAREVRQDSDQETTTRDRITGREMQMPATRMVATDVLRGANSVQHLVADQAHGKPFELEIG